MYFNHTSTTWRNLGYIRVKDLPVPAPMDRPRTSSGH